MSAVEITDAEIRAYLLGATAAERTESIDELTFVDTDFAAQVEVVERDLVDEYHRNELDAADRQRFEDHYLRSPLRREKAGFGSSFREYIDAGSNANHIRAETANETKASWFTAWWKIGFAAAAAAILIGVAVPLWLNSSTQQQAVNPPTNNSANNTNSPDQQIARAVPDPIVDPPVVIPETSPSEVPVNSRPVNSYSPEPSAVPRVFAFTLLPQTRGAEGEKRVSIPPKTSSASITLQLEPTDFRTVLVELKDQGSGSVVWRTKAQPSRVINGYQSVRLTIPSRLLSSGRYSIAVSAATGQTDREIIGDYPFAIMR